MSRILYFTSWYNEKHAERSEELKKCVQNCIDSPEIDTVFLLCEGGAVFPHQGGDSTKLVEIFIEKRPTYQLFFECMRKFSEPGDIVIMGNTDIYPHPGVKEQLLNNLKENECYALTRWDVQPDGINSVLFDRPDSQDVWCFKAPIKTINGGEFTQGRGGCDNKIALQIKESGYIVKNPSRSIKFLHLHNTNIRNYTTADIIPGPYHLIHPTFLNQTTIKYDF